MKLETDRLILRSYSKTDLMDLFEYLSDPEVVKYEPYRSMMLDDVRGELDRRILSDELVAVELKSTGKLIGNIYLGNKDNNVLEIGFAFNKEYSKQGYAKEGCTALINEAFSTGTEKIIAQCDPENESSWLFLERLGFIRTSHLKKNVYFWKNKTSEPTWKDTYIYTLERPAVN